MWPGALLWAILCISDYMWTIICARLYKAQSVLVFEGSYELTPAFQKDIDMLRRVSPRFIIALVPSTVFLCLLWQISTQLQDWRYYVYTIGALILLQLAIHIRHLRNWFLFRYGFGPQGMKGHIEYPRELVLRMSALEILLFAVVFLILYALSANLLFLGGATSCAVTAFKHYRLARKHKMLKASAVS